MVSADAPAETRAAAYAEIGMAGSEIGSDPGKLKAGSEEGERRCFGACFLSDRWCTVAVIGHVPL
jgi:hypothetical protein